MRARRAGRLIVLFATVAAVVAWPAKPAMAFTEGASDNYFGTGAGAGDTGGNAGDHNNSFFGGLAGNANTTGLNNAFFGLQAGRFNTGGIENTFVGVNAGLNNTTSSQNAFVGHNAGMSNTASLNSFFGDAAGLSNTSGSANAFFGQAAGRDNTTGAANAFFGQDAGNNNTTGQENALFGHLAGWSNTTASNNAFFGESAGFLNTTGDRNAFFGNEAGFSNDTGFVNAFFGASSGDSNTTGFDNAFFGFSAGADNTTGFDNSFFGGVSGNSNTTGENNAFFGAGAGSANTTGSHNAFFGGAAGDSNTTGTGNSFLGTLSDGPAAITNATAVGYQSRVSQSNALVLGSINGVNGAASNVDVGIGTTTPDDPLHVRRANGTAKVLVEEASGTTLGRELFELVNNGAARFRVRNTSNNAIWDFQSSSNAGSFVIDKVGGPASLDFEMQPDGDLVVRGSVTGTSFISSSDRKLKTDITPADAQRLIGLLRRLDISTWRFKDQATGTVNLGPMAQDFHRLFGMGTETTIDIRDLAALALLGVQALDRRLTEVEAAN